MWRSGFNPCIRKRSPELNGKSLPHTKNQPWKEEPGAIVQGKELTQTGDWHNNSNQCQHDEQSPLQNADAGRTKLSNPSAHMHHSRQINRSDKKTEALQHFYSHGTCTKTTTMKYLMCEWEWTDECWNLVNAAWRDAEAWWIVKVEDAAQSLEAREKYIFNTPVSSQISGQPENISARQWNH